MKIGVGMSALMLVALAGCGGSSAPPRPALPAHVATTVIAPPARTAPAVTKPRPKAKRKPTNGADITGGFTIQSKPKPNPGSLPQTDQRPSAETATFHAELLALWSGVQKDSLAKAMPAFFPEGAYVQVKAIGDPQSDYSGRLIGDYGLDLAAAHAVLGADPASADLVGLELPPSSVHWVPPGACYNRVGYYEWPNARLLYRQRGALHSFGIASMISWRGVWYVIHLGAVVRAGDTGVVDDPSPGVGVSVPSSTC